MWLLMEQTQLRKLAGLDRQVHELTKDFHNSTPVASYAVKGSGGNSHGGRSVSFDIKDALLIAAVTESPVLMIGDTDSGKTTLAKLVMNALFGQPGSGFSKLDIDTSFSDETLATIDFGAISGGKTSDQLYSIASALKMPGLIIDEMNRTDPRLAAKLLHILLEKEVTIAGRPHRIGHMLPNGSTYQFQIAAINSGYKGTFEMDEALVRRAVMELPMNMFPPGMADFSMLLSSVYRDIPLRETKSHLEDVLSVKDAVSGIALDPEVSHFLLYLHAMESCVKSATGTKGGIEMRQGSSLKPFCINNGSGVACHFLNEYQNEMCPNVRGLSAGVAKNLILLSQGFAALRGTKMAAGETNEEDYSAIAGNLKVEVQDMVAAVPFVGYSKMGMSAEWVIKQFRTSRWHAVKGVVESAYQKFSTFYLQNFDALSKAGTPGLSKEEAMRVMRDAWQQDHFMYFSLVTAQRAKPQRQPVKLPC